MTSRVSQTTRHFTTRPVVERTPEGAVAKTRARVTHTTRRVTTQLVTLRTSEATIVTTPGHPFAKVGAGWTQAAKLAAGDRIVTRESQDAAIVEVEVRRAPLTPVYNLSVARTHAYFVSERDLLVHNVDCAPASGPTRLPLAEQTKNAIEEHNKAGRPETAAGIAGAAKRHEKAQQKLGRLMFPFNSKRDPVNCLSCTLASLKDLPSVFWFLQKHGNVPGVLASRHGVIPRHEIPDIMRNLLLTSPNTPALRHFPSDEPAPRTPPFKEWENVAKFIEESGANTFAVAFTYVDEDGNQQAHILVAVRHADGSLEYLEFQSDPPESVDIKETYDIVDVTVIPTDVDWRMNRHLYWHVTQNKYRPRARRDSAAPSGRPQPVPGPFPPPEAR